MNNWLDAEIQVQFHAHIFFVANVAFKKKWNSLNAVQTEFTPYWL